MSSVRKRRTLFDLIFRPAFGSFAILATLLVSAVPAQNPQTSPADRQRQMQALQDRQRQLQQATPQQGAGQRGAAPRAVQQVPQGASQPGNPQAPRAANANPRTAEAPAARRAPQKPFQLTPEKEARLNQLLDYWESRSAKVKTYSCEFTRLDYDHVFGPKNPKWPKTKSEGQIRFASPDKGEFRVNSVGRFTPPTAEGGEPTYPFQKDDAAEHWICNGTAVFELNAKSKQLIERKLPPEMRGTQIADGPLPFMFGAKKEKLLRRYWIQELEPPKGYKGQYWLEAYPRLAETAAEFQRVRVILDEKTFLPNAIEVYPPNYNPRTNPSRTVYIFQDRRVNDPIHQVREFMGGFISPKTPRGWKKIVQNFNDPGAGPNVAAKQKPGVPGGGARRQ